MTIQLLKAQSTDLQFFSLEDGISNNRVWSVAQTSDGFIWLHSDGLNRFDGYNFVNHRNHSDSIFTPFTAEVRSIYAWDNKLILHLPKGLKLLDTHDGSIEELDFRRWLLEGETIAPYHHRFIYRTPIADKIVLAVFDNQSWTKILVYDTGQVHIHELEEAIIFGDNSFEPSLFEDGLFYVSRNKSSEVIAINLEGRIVNRWPYPIVAGPNASNVVRQNVDGSPLLFLDGVFYGFDSSTSNWIKHPIDYRFKDGIADFQVSAQGDIWITGNGDRQVYRFNSQQQILENYTEIIKEQIPFRLGFQRSFLDQTGSVWVFSIIGILRISPGTTYFQSFFKSSDIYCGGSCSFRAFTEDDQGRVYGSFYPNIIEASRSNEDELEPILAEHLGFTPFDLGWHSDRFLLPNGFVF
ncbi:MAG: two-component regulator propeller domain-containing protein, partial [Bacteroidota bacterium]